MKLLENEISIMRLNDTEKDINLDSKENLRLMLTYLHYKNTIQDNEHGLIVDYDYIQLSKKIFDKSENSYK